MLFELSIGISLEFLVTLIYVTGKVKHHLLTLLKANDVTKCAQRDNNDNVTLMA